jgi:hypothetical protein
MAKRKRPEKADGEVNEERGVKPIPIWEKNWFPAALFLLLSLLYFHEFVLSDKVVYGYDAGLDFHKGEGMSFWEKVETMAQPMWNPQMGGLPQSEEIRPQYFLTYPIYFFTTFHRYLGWRLYPDYVFFWVGYVFVFKANTDTALGRYLGGSGLYVGPDANGLYLCGTIRQNGRYSALSLDVVLPRSRII